MYVSVPQTLPSGRPITSNSTDRPMSSTIEFGQVPGIGANSEQVAAELPHAGPDGQRLVEFPLASIVLLHSSQRIHQFADKRGKFPRRGLLGKCDRGIGLVADLATISFGLVADLGDLLVRPFADRGDRVAPRGRSGRGHPREVRPATIRSGSADIFGLRAAAPS